MKNRHLARSLAGICLLLILPLVSACSDGASPSEEEPGPDLTTPNGTMRALADFYSYREAANALALFDPSYRFYPTNPGDIPFLAPGATSWDFDQETAILELLLVPERTTWIDQVLLEIIKREQRNLPDGTVEFDANVQLIVLIGPQNLVRSESEITYVLRKDEADHYLLLEERESPAAATDALPVGQLRAEVLEDRGRTGR